MSRRNLIAGGVAVALAMGWIGYRMYLASQDIVTLHVRNMPLEKVMGKLRWQTWETFEWHKDLTNTLTLDVDRMPLREVLEIISEQAECRWTVAYPLYSRKEHLASLVQALEGDIKISESKFTNWSSRPLGGPGGGPGGGGPGGFGGMGGPGGFAENIQAENNLVSLQITNKEVALAAKAISRFARSQVVPENGAQSRVNVVLEQTPMDQAVAKVAKSARLKWTKFYALERGGRGGFPGGMPFAGGGPGGGMGGPRGERGERGPRPDGPRAERGREQMQEMVSMLPPEQQQQVQANQELRREIQSLTPEQRQQLASDRINSPEGQAMQQQMQQRSAANLRNSTPEQRRDRYERMYQMRQAREAARR